MQRFEGYHIVPASKWVRLSGEKQKLLRDAGGFPVNDHFITLWERPVTSKMELLLLYGGYGSSKTTDRIQELVLLAISEPYFRCFYGRQVFDLAKRELHSNIVTVIQDMGLEHLFTYSTSPNGNKEISCNLNGNKFKPFGCDDTDSLKGLDNPTHIFVDELDQIEYKNFGMLLTRLRTKKGKKCFVGCFNTCDVFEDHWIRTILLNKDEPLKDPKGNVINLNIIEHFSVYTDNYFIDHDEYLQAMSIQAGNDPERLEAIVSGSWGAKTTGQPFYKDFNAKLHVAYVEYNPRLALHVSFDENVNPYLPCSIWQFDGKNAYCIDEIAAENPKNKIAWVCSEIYRRYGPGGKNHEGGFFIYGDATSRKEDTKVERGKDFFVFAKEYLEYFKPRLRVGKSNPNAFARGNFINAVFGSNYDGHCITISSVCKHVIADLLHTAENPDGNGKQKPKETVDGVRGVQRWGHFSDSLDYVLCEVWMSVYLRFKNGGKPSKWVEIKRTAHNYF